VPDQVRVFVSHHHSPEENAFTAQLVAALERAGADVWVDTERIPSGDFVRKINEGLSGRQWLVLVMTPDALRSPWVQTEVNAAVNQVNAGHMLGVIPFVAQACDERDIPPLWANLQRYNAILDYQAALSGLLRALGLRAPTEEPTTVAAETPAPVAAPAQAPAQQPAPAKPDSLARRTRVVDPHGHGDHRTVSEAIRAAEHGDRIIVRPGTYTGTIVIDKPLELVGEGDRDVIIIELREGAVTMFMLSETAEVTVRSTGVQLSNISVRVIPMPVLGGFSDAIVVTSGGELQIDGCDISSSNTGKSGIWVKSGKVTVRDSDIHDCGYDGVVLEGREAKAVVEDSTIRNCGLERGGAIGSFAAVLIKPGAMATVRRNRIINNKHCAIQVDAGGYGVFEDNDLRGNGSGPWTIANSAIGNVERARNLE
jgi:hypothetical protein